MGEATDRVLAAIRAERDRQQAAEGWTTEHDDEHYRGELAWAALGYLSTACAWMANRVPTGPLLSWPWKLEDWKPKDKRTDLLRAAALIVAELEREDRLDAQRRLLGDFPPLTPTSGG